MEALCRELADKVTQHIQEEVKKQLSIVSNELQAAIEQQVRNMVGADHVLQRVDELERKLSFVGQILMRTEEPTSEPLATMNPLPPTVAMVPVNLSPPVEPSPAAHMSVALPRPIQSLPGERASTCMASEAFEKVPATAGPAADVANSALPNNILPVKAPPPGISGLTSYTTVPLVKAPPAASERGRT